MKIVDRETYTDVVFEGLELTGEFNLVKFNNCKFINCDLQLVNFLACQFNGVVVFEDCVMKCVNFNDFCWIDKFVIDNVVYDITPFIGHECHDKVRFFLNLS